MPEEVEIEIAGLEDLRYEAMLNKDIASLDRLLDERLRYVHSSGVIDTKETYLRGVSQGVWNYRHFERGEQVIVPHGETALVFNRLTIDLDVNSVPKRVDGRALAVWAKTPHGWRLVAVQSSSTAGAGK